MSETVGWDADTIMAVLHERRDTLRQMGVRRLGLFGSYVRGEQSSASDIDLVFAMERFTWTRWMDVWNYLENVFGARVDLIPEKDLRAELRPTVLAEVRYVAEL